MCVFVRCFQLLLVDMRVLVGVSVVAVLMLVLDVFMIVLNMRVRVHDVPVGVLMGMRCTGHQLLHPGGIRSDWRGSQNHMGRN